LYVQPVIRSESIKAERNRSAELVRQTRMTGERLFRQAGFSPKNFHPRVFADEAQLRE
jgi:hypothetical protein